jgi:hypothetical protein
MGMMLMDMTSLLFSTTSRRNAIDVTLVGEDNVELSRVITRYAWEES